MIKCIRKHRLRESISRFRFLPVGFARSAGSFGKRYNIGIFTTGPVAPE